MSSQKIGPKEQALRDLRERAAAKPRPPIKQLQTIAEATAEHMRTKPARKAAKAVSGKGGRKGRRKRPQRATGAPSDP